VLSSREQERKVAGFLKIEERVVGTRPTGQMAWGISKASSHVGREATKSGSMPFSPFPPFCEGKAKDFSLNGTHLIARSTEFLHNSTH